MSIYESDEYIENNPDYHQGDSEWKAQHIVSLLAESGCHPKTIAEVGCGAGKLLQIVSSTLGTSHADGFDVSPSGIALAKQHETVELKFYNQDFLHLKISAMSTT